MKEDRESFTIGAGVSVADEANAVAIRIEGEALANLRKLAEIFGAWDGLPDMTAAELAAKYLRYDDAFRDLAERKRDRCFSTLAGRLVAAYADADDVSALKAAMVAGGFDVNE